MMTGSFFSLAQLLGYAALILGVSAFLQKSDRRLKVLIATESLAYVAHFILLGNYAASGSALASCLRMLVSLKSRAKGWIAFFVAVSLFIGVFFSKGWCGWLPVVASSLATVAVFALHGVVMRLVLLVCTLLWLANNWLSGSIGGTVLETIIALVNLWTIVRLWAGGFPACPARDADVARPTAAA